MEFKQAVVTQNGRALMAKLLAGKSTQFTKIKVSSTIYPDAQLADLTALTNIEQEATAQAYGNTTATLSVVGAIENTGLTTGYYINTVGLYAVDPDKGEILYSVSSASKNGYMPPDTGVSKSGLEFKIYTEVGNATKVDLTVDPAAFATHEDIERVSTLKTAYSWSLDGTDRFMTKYPKENVLNQTAFNEKGSWTFVKPTGSVSTAIIEDGVAKIQASNDFSANWKHWEMYINPTDTAYDKIKTLSERKSSFSVSYRIPDITYVPSGGPKAVLIILKTNSGINILEKYLTVKDIKVGVWDRMVLTQIMPNISMESEKFRIIIETTLNNCPEIQFDDLKLEAGDASPYVPAPSEDYENAYPDYIGLAPGYSEKPEDYVWLPEPTKNQKKLDELVTLKDQVADMQSWIQVHS